MHALQLWLAIILYQYIVEAELGITRYKSNALRNNYYFCVEKVI